MDPEIRCKHGSVSECPDCAVESRDAEYALTQQLKEREKDQLSSELARVCAEKWGAPVRVVDHLHVRTTQHGMGDSLSVRFEADYVDRNYCSTVFDDVRRQNVWVPAINGHDLPWQLSPKVAAHVAINEAEKRRDGKGSKR